MQKFPMVIGIVLLAACAQPAPDIQSFEDCMLAGYPIMESMPRRCSVSNGPTFTEELPPIVRGLSDLHGSFLGLEPDAGDGIVTFRFKTDEGVERAVLEPDAAVIATSTNFGPADLHDVASGTILNVQGWKDEEGVVHAVKIRIRD